MPNKIDNRIKNKYNTNNKSNGDRPTEKLAKFINFRYIKKFSF